MNSYSIVGIILANLIIKELLGQMPPKMVARVTF